MDSSHKPLRLIVNLIYNLPILAVLQYKAKVIGAEYRIEWPELDYYLSVEGLRQGQPEAPGLSRVKMAAVSFTGPCVITFRT